MARLALAAALVLIVTACSSSKHSGTTTTTTTGPIKSPIVVKRPLSNTQWRSPISVKGTSSLPGKLTVEVEDASGKQFGSKDTTASDGRFAVKVPFTVKKLLLGAVVVHDQSKNHAVVISVTLSP